MTLAYNRFIIVNRMKKIAFLMISISLVFVFTGIAIAAEPYRIGAVLGVTGRLSFVGQPQKEAITLVAEQINKQGG